MSDRGRRADRRAFRPGQDLGAGRAGRLALEPRLLLSSTRGSARVAAKAEIVTGSIGLHTAFGGKILKVRDVDGEKYDVDITGGGIVTGRPMSGGRVKLIVAGSTADSILSINPSAVTRRVGTAHTLPVGLRHIDHLLHIGAIEITSGRIGQILGRQTADLSGPIVVSGTAPVDRITFAALKPGASITTGGDLNTLDTFGDLSIGGGPGITVGRDLNWLDVNGNLNIGAGSTFQINRDLGLTAQVAKGSDPGGQGAHVHGDFTIANGGLFQVGRSLDGTFIVDGNVTGAINSTTGNLSIVIPNLALGENFFVRGGINP